MARPRSPAPLWLPGAALLLGLGALPPVLTRMEFDRRDRPVHLVADLGDLEVMARGIGLPRAALLDRVAKTGVSAAAVVPRSLRDLIEAGLAERLPAPAGRRAFRLAPAAEEYAVAPTLAPVLASRLEGDVLTVEADGPMVEELRLFLPAGIFAELAARRLAPVLRIQNLALNRAYLEAWLGRIPDGATLVFDDKECLGWPAALGRVADRLRGRPLALGWVEFSEQRGVDLLAVKSGVPLRVVHSIPAEEMEKYPLERVLPRWVRAVEERRVRVLYLHTFPARNLPYDREDALTANLEYLAKVVAEIRAAGYVPGEPLDPLTEIPARGRLPRVAACLATGALVAWLAWFFGVLPAGLLLGAGLAGGLAAGAACGFADRGLVPNLLALAAAIAAPAAAVLHGLAVARTGRARGLVAAPVLCFLASVVAGTVVFALLSHPGYLLRLESFRGVKAVYLGPLALIAAVLLHRVDGYRRRLRLAELGMLGAAALAGAVYLLRSGNFSPLPASDAEHQVRDSLEALLPYRPRTKEVLVGYPALGFMVAAAAAGDRFWAGWGALGGGVAGVSATNSFCHLHAPFEAAVGRGALGLLIGLPVGLLGALVHALVRRRGRRRYWVVAGYAGHGNYGDDAITRRLLAELGARRPRGVRLAVLLPRGSTLALPEGVEGVGRFDLLGLVTVLRHAELFATGPGGLVQDRTGWKTPVYYLGLHALARALGVGRTAFLGEGFGPLTGTLARRALAWYTASADLVLVRDPGSRDLAGPGAELGPDAYFWGPPPPARAVPAPRDGPLGLVLRDLPENAPCFALPLARALAAKARELGLKGVRLLAAQPAEDGPLTRILVENLAKEGFAVTAGSLQEAEDQGTLAELSVLASMRLHGCFLAVEHEIPLVALPYDPKVRAFLDATGYPYQADPEGDPVLAAAALGRLHAERDGVPERLRMVQRVVRAGRERVLELLDGLVGRGTGTSPAAVAREDATRGVRAS